MLNPSRFYWGLPAKMRRENANQKLYDVAMMYVVHVIYRHRAKQ